MTDEAIDLRSTFEQARFHGDFFRQRSGQSLRLAYVAGAPFADDPDGAFGCHWGNFMLQLDLTPASFQRPIWWA